MGQVQYFITRLKIHNNLIVIFFVNEDGEMPYEEDFLQGYSEGCLTSLSPYVGGVYDKMSTDYQVYTQQTVSRVYKIQILTGIKNNVHCSSSF